MSEHLLIFNNFFACRKYESLNFFVKLQMIDAWINYSDQHADGKCLSSIFQQSKDMDNFLP